MAIKITKGEARGYLKEYVLTITSPSKGKQYVCPLCGSGTGRNKSGAFSISDDGTTWRCFSCDEHGDVFDLIGRIEGLDNYVDQMKWFESWKGMLVTSDNDLAPAKPTLKTTTTNYITYFKTAAKRIDETSYHRGLTAETLQRFMIGFDPAWRHPDVSSKVPTSPRLIIPTSSESYIARDTREEIPEDARKYAKQKAGTTHIFNAIALQRATRPIFVVEGEIDALSIIDVGGEAVGLGSVSNIDKLIDLIKSKRPEQPLVIALDNDKVGKERSEQLAKSLQDMNIPFYRENPAGSCKDANEALMTDREAFTETIGQIYHRLTMTAEEREAEERAEYSRRSAANFIDSDYGIMREIERSKGSTVYGTGFTFLDDMLDGGLYEGLYIIGAISSLGKTAMIMQIADQIAQQGGDVLYFTLEMGRFRLMARSISRLTAQYCLEQGGDMRNAKTARGILDGRRYVGFTKPSGQQVPPYTSDDMRTIKEAMRQYKEYADHLYIYEGHNDTGVDDVEQAIKDHIHFTGRTPVVVIDYLQILAPHDPKATDKQNTDYTMNSLARIVREYRLPIISISSFNRESYKGKSGKEADMTSFKESGLIEYGADVLIGLQLHGTGESGFDVNASKRQDMREIEAVILKNRDGKTGTKSYFNYYPAFNLFRNVSGAMDFTDEV